ncbi:hypothetical protein AKJ40_04535 [candidate division MSBL1 archaeon SCGC-AAA259M10]|uniref:Potassium transporter TrkA n=4 Tax=candidate division MSBL1 TaxID=215777 RepID=A0A133UQZ4_9EURY|nr:hypothetical protein AKJ61_02805 [candidate division MSBL1 archaeon SCGC-AAA259B11]KXA92181.1 hypothetical protein AKJ66_04575 [candidate division MSBL1 archaeon SCGC-AAA259E22]KXA96664.1 hypothetical protein AKJ38_02875 [candidate division MSBL1 archaeon SCGC-AAA259I14]KXA98703.1 hypothetical protein AKJ40_04535 [candidate division MSBL1 archaeon SCGC-AAA259M10]
MYIIVAGLGMLGMRVIKELSEGRHDVIGVDIDKKVCEKAGARTGAIIVNGDATNLDTLHEANINRADICIGLIGRDSANLAFTSLASAFNVPKILVRMNDPSYKEAYLQTGAEKALNTADIYMDSLVMDIERPSFKEVTELGNGEASVVLIEVPDDSPVLDQSIAEIIMLEDFPANCIFAGVFREEEFIVPRGNQEIRAKDRVFLTGDSESLEKAAKCMGVEPS